MGRPKDRASSTGLLPRMEARPRKDGHVTYRYHPLGGKPVNLGIDKAEAIRAVLDMNMSTSDAGTMNEIWRAYQLTPQWKRLAPRSKTDYTTYSVELLRVFGAAPAAGIRPADIARYLRVERGSAPVRANREIALLSNLMNVAIERGDIEANPCKQIRRNKEQPRTEAPEPAELLAFTDWVGKQSEQRQIVGMMAEFAALAGNRRIEFLQITRPQIDRKAGLIRLHRAKQHDGKVRVESIQISPPMEALLLRLDKLPRAADCLYVFTNEDGNPYGDSGFTTMWWRLMEAALAEKIVERRFTFHDLRAFYATQHKAQFGALPEMHANPATTARVYDRSKVVNRKSLG